MRLGRYGWFLGSMLREMLRGSGGARKSPLGSWVGRLLGKEIVSRQRERRWNFLGRKFIKDYLCDIKQTGYLTSTNTRFYHRAVGGL